MRSAILEQPGQISIKDQDVPTPGPGELLLRVKCATTCGTDLKAYLRGHPQIPMPGPFGHEYAGEVSEVGEGVTAFSPGDEVMGVHSAPCGDCHWCLRDQENLCHSTMEKKILGSFSEYLLIPKHIVSRNLFPKPAQLEFRRASLLEPLACVANAVSRIVLRPDDRILLIGTGSIGLLFRGALRMMGSPAVYLLGRRQERLSFMESNGIQSFDAAGLDDLIRRETEGRGFDLVVECAGNVDAWTAATKAVRRGGTMVLFGGCPAGSSFQIDTSRLHYDDITIISPFHFGVNAVRRAREWLLSDKFDPGPLITSSAPLENVTDVFELLKSGSGIKVALVP